MHLYANLQFACKTVTYADFKQFGWNLGVCCMNGVKTESNWPWILRNAKDKEAGSARDIFQDEDSTSEILLSGNRNANRQVQWFTDWCCEIILFHNIFQVCTRATQICQRFPTIGWKIRQNWLFTFQKRLANRTHSRPTIKWQLPRVFREQLPISNQVF